MRYKIKYQTRGKVESYIAAVTSLVASLNGFFEEHELESTLQNIADYVEEMAATTAKGITAKPQCEIEHNDLSVRNTLGREILTVWFERVYDNGWGGQVKRL